MLVTLDEFLKKKGFNISTLNSGTKNQIWFINSYPMQPQINLNYLKVKLYVYTKDYSIRCSLHYKNPELKKEKTAGMKILEQTMVADVKSYIEMYIGDFIKTK
jgi:hypothetical protein